MEVHFYATLRSIAGGKTAHFPVNGNISAQELLDAIVTRFPGMRRELLDEQGRLYGHVHFFINGRDVRFLQDDLATIIEPQDVINVFPAVGGG